MSDIRMITYTPPVNFSETDRAIFYFIDGSEQLVEPCVLEYRDAALHIGTRAVLDKSIKSFFKIAFAHIRVRYFLVKIDKPVVQITDGYSVNYFHWMTEALPKLFVMREKGWMH
jgi:hypothetical protein